MFYQFAPNDEYNKQEIEDVASLDSDWHSPVERNLAFGPEAGQVARELVVPALTAPTCAVARCLVPCERK